MGTSDSNTVKKILIIKILITVANVQYVLSLCLNAVIRALYACVM